MNNSYATPFFIRLYRSSRLIAHVLLGVAIAASFLNKLKPYKRDLVIRWWSKRLLNVLNAELKVYGIPPTIKASRIMLIGNHVSWLDIYAVNSVRSVRFIAKSDIRQWPVFGWLAAKANTFFINRGLRQEAGRMVATATAALKNGDCLCYFPEGTTTDGHELKPFKGSILQSAIDADAAIWPFVIRYLDSQGNINVNLAYYGEISFVESIGKILSCRKPMIELTFLPPIATINQDRRMLVLHARNAIKKQLNPSR